MGGGFYLFSFLLGGVCGEESVGGMFKCAFGYLGSALGEGGRFRLGF